MPERVRSESAHNDSNTKREAGHARTTHNANCHATTCERAKQNSAHLHGDAVGAQVEVGLATHDLRARVVEVTVEHFLGERQRALRVAAERRQALVELGVRCVCRAVSRKRRDGARAR